MTEVTIIGLERTMYTEPTAKGHLILAYFTARVGVFTLKGCSLVRTAGGRLAAWLPNLTDPKQRDHRSIRLDDKPTGSALLQAALQMYRRMGGDDAEREPPAPSGDNADQGYRTDEAADDEGGNTCVTSVDDAQPVRRPIAVKRTVTRIASTEPPDETFHAALPPAIRVGERAIAE